MRKPTISYHMEEKRLGFLYAIRCGDFVKVGVTTDMLRRVEEIARHNPHPLRAEMCRPLQRRWMQAVEKEVHRQLAAHHHHGEWFTATTKEVRSATAKAIRQAQALAGEDVRVLNVCASHGIGGQRVYIDDDLPQAFVIRP